MREHQVSFGIVITAVLLLVSLAAIAHPGGVNSSGCHTNRSSGEYHCHDQVGDEGGAGVKELQGRAVAVTDGDTIKVLDANNVSYKIRLSGIDAPEKSQPFNAPGSSASRVSSPFSVSRARLFLFVVAPQSSLQPES